MERRKVKYTGTMDPGMAELCDALNRLPGVRTTESCCGHGKEPASVFFDCSNLDSLAKIQRSIDIRYGGQRILWTLGATTTDTFPHHRPLSFYIKSDWPYPDYAKWVPDLPMGAVYWRDIRRTIANINLHSDLDYWRFVSNRSDFSREKMEYATRMRSMATDGIAQMYSDDRRMELDALYRDGRPIEENVPWIRPCPYCGKQPKIVYSEPGWEDRVGVAVRCQTEGCYNFFNNGWEGNELDAIEKWNMGVSLPKGILR